MELLDRVLQSVTPAYEFVRSLVWFDTYHCQSCGEEILPEYLAIEPDANGEHHVVAVCAGCGASVPQPTSRIVEMFG